MQRRRTQKDIQLSGAMELRRPPQPLPQSLLLLLVLLGPAQMAVSLPIVDPGLFVILGVRTCGAGAGYCLLGSDCTLDRDFAPDESGGHCAGLRFAFTPAAHFVCCRYVERSNTTLPGEPADVTTTENPANPANPADNLVDADTAHTQVWVSVTSTTSAPDETAPKVNTDSTEVPIPPEDSQTEAPGTTNAPAPEESVQSNAVEPEAAVDDLVVETHVAVSEPYRVSNEAGQGSDVAEQQDSEEEEIANVVEDSTACGGGRNTTDVNPCWRASFVDAAGTVLCSGSLIAPNAVVTTTLCANRLMEADVRSVTLRAAGTSLAVQSVSTGPVGQDYPDQNADPRDIAVVRLAAPEPEGGAGVDTLAGQSGHVSRDCIACLAPGPGTARDGKTCFALAARLSAPPGGASSAVCAGTVAASDGGLLKLDGCEVPTLDVASTGGQAQRAVFAREGSALLCDGALVGLASTARAGYHPLASHRLWLLNVLKPFAQPEVGPAQSFRL